MNFDVPMKLTEIMQGFTLPWGICGGWALDLYLNRVTRDHKDVDVAILRRDQLPLQEILLESGWEMEIARKGTFIKWEPGIPICSHLHTIWCKQGDDSLGFIEILLNEAEGDRFIFRREPRVHMNLGSAFERSPSGIPILAPEIVLLYMATGRDLASHVADFVNTLANLTSDRMKWLRDALELIEPDHSWLNILKNTGA